MNSRPSSAGTSKTRASAMLTSNPDHLNSTARLSTLIALTKKTATKSSRTSMTSIWEKLAHWERFYNLSKPDGAFNGEAPYRAPRVKL